LKNAAVASIRENGDLRTGKPARQFERTNRRRYDVIVAVDHDFATEEAETFLF
jgi:hypothetical protein